MRDQNRRLGGSLSKREREIERGISGFWIERKGLVLFFFPSLSVSVESFRDRAPWLLLFIFVCVMTKVSLGLGELPVGKRSTGWREEGLP